MRRFFLVLTAVSAFTLVNALSGETPAPQELTPEEETHQWNNGYRIVPGLGRKGYDLLTGPDGVIGDIREDGSITDKIYSDKVIGHIDDYKQFFPARNWR